MSTTGNLCVWNPLNIGSGGTTTLSEGNTTCVMTGADPRTTGTIAGIVTDTDGFYFETVATATGSGALTLGIVVEDRHNQVLAGQIHSRSGSWMWRSYDGGVFFIETSSNTSYGTFADGDILGWFVKAGKLYVKKNNSNVVGDVSAESGGLTLSGHYFFPAVSRTVGGGSGTTAVLRPDSDSWSYTPPSGFKGLTAKDMTISSGIDPSGDDGETENPTKQCNAVTYTGNGTTGQSITGLGFKPDLLFLKSTSSSQSWRVHDSSRGGSKMMFADLNNAESSDAQFITAFGSDGWTFGTSGSNANDNSVSYLGVGWRINGATTSSNTNGSITSTVQVNTNAGISCVQWTGSGSNATIGHGLSGVDFMIVKDRSNANDWAVYHKSVASDPQTDYLLLNSGVGASDDSTYWNDTAPTSTVFSVGSNADTNASSANMIAYCFQSIEGYSLFTSYTGNGSADGSVCYLGFRPSILWIKKSSGTNDWGQYTAVGTPFNQIEKVLRQDASTAYTTSGRSIDFTSTGFKLRTSNATFNGSGGTYVVMAWGNPSIKFGNTF